jgi:hypothetical protein
VTLTQGSISCDVAKVLTSNCTTVVPTSVNMGNQNGPALNGNAFYYFFDGSTAANWPTHDPCGQNQGNQLDGVAQPGGAIYVR